MERLRAPIESYAEAARSGEGPGWGSVMLALVCLVAVVALPRLWALYLAFLGLSPVQYVVSLRSTGQLFEPLALARAPMTFVLDECAQHSRGPAAALMPRSSFLMLQRADRRVMTIHPEPDRAAEAGVHIVGC